MLIVNFRIYLFWLKNLQNKPQEKYLEIATFLGLKYILNSITNNFTKFELGKMTHFKSTYPKNMFRRLKQYKHTGYMKVKAKK